MTIYEILADMQKRLKAPKGQWNNFGKYNYRSCEDILEAVKELNADCAVILEDSMEQIGDRIYIKATASVIDKEGNKISTSAYAREAESKKGMDEAQVTGATSSYARKYALNALFAIDDAKDADSTNDHGASENQEKQQKGSSDQQEKPWYNDFEKQKATMIERIASGTTADQIIKSLRDKYKLSKAIADQIKALETA